MTDLNKFTAKEISTILRSCKESGVTNFKCGGLELSFEPAVVESHVVEEVYEDPRQDQAVHQEIEDDDDLRALDLQNLMISDPIAYEKHMRHEAHEGSERSE